MAKDGEDVVLDDEVVEGNEPGDDGGDEGGDGKGKTIPMERFNKVYGQMKTLEKAVEQFKAFGDPTKLQEQLQRLEKYDKAVEDYRQKSNMTKEDRDRQEKAVQLRKELVELFPALAGLDSLKEINEKLSQLEERNTSSAAEKVLEGHSAKFANVLKVNKIDPKYQERLENYIVSQMTDAQQAAFVKGDFSIAEEIFKRDMDEGLLSVFKQRATVPAPPKRNIPGGTESKGKPKKAMTLKEAEDAAWSRMSSEE